MIDLNELLRESLQEARDVDGPELRDAETDFAKDGTSRPGSIPEVIVLSIIELLVVLLSSLIILLILAHRSLRRNYTNWLVANACAVVLFGAVFYRWAYILMASYEGVWKLGDGYCHITWFSHAFLHFNRPLSLFLVTVNCAVFVYNPLTFGRKITKYIVLLMIGLSWFFAFVYATVRTYGLGWPDISENPKICYQRTNAVHGTSKMTGLLFEHALDVVVLAVTTIVVLVYSWKLHKDAPKGDPELVEERQKQAKQAAYLTGSINFFYILLTLPLFCVAVQLFAGSVKSGSVSARIAYVLDAFYDLVQMILWIVLIPDVTYGVTSMSECLTTDPEEKTRLL